MAVVINGSAGVTTNSGAVYNGISAGTAVASTSGTSIDFTSIPSWVKRITVMFKGVSTNGASAVQVQLGSTTFTTSGYAGASGYTATSGQGYASTTNLSSGFALAGGATSVQNGSICLSLLTANDWVCSGVVGRSDSTVCMIVGGVVSISGTLDRVRITTVNGTDTFDAGSINILYE